MTWSRRQAGRGAGRARQSQTAAATAPACASLADFQVSDSDCASTTTDVSDASFVREAHSVNRTPSIEDFREHSSSSASFEEAPLGMAGVLSASPPSSQRRGMSLALLLLLVALTAVLDRVAGKMDISAYEYRRKFGTPLEMGGCPNREVKVELGNTSVIWAVETCIFKKEGHVTSLDRELNDTRNVVIPTANDIIFYLGLCGGDAASYLGILNKGDCVAVEIASKLLFNDKTVVRAYVEYYRKSLDILENASKPPSEFGHHYADKYYLRNRSYGTIEVILVQFRFKSTQSARIAKEISLNSLLMSDYLDTIQREVEVPRQTMLIRLSTADLGDYSVEKFKPRQYQEAIRHCQVLESDIRHIREQISTGAKKPHLNYGLFPFKEAGAYRAPVMNPVTWEKTSMLEVSLRQSIRVGRRAIKQCKGLRIKACRRVRGINRKLKQILKEIHGGRTQWMELPPEQRLQLANNYTADVTSHGSAMRSQARDVRKELKLLKLKERQKRRKDRNTTRARGIRHLRMLQKSKRPS